MPVTITINGENASHALAELRDFSAGMKYVSTAAQVAEALRAGPTSVTVDFEEPTAAPAPMTVEVDPVPSSDNGASPAVDKRRKRRGSAAASEVAPAPQIKEDDAETQEQDAADEAAEAERGRKEGKLTLDDLRSALHEYVSAFGMDAAQQDGTRILAAVLAGDASARKPDGSPYRVPDVPENNEDISRAIEGVHEALKKNPFKRERFA